VHSKHDRRVDLDSKKRGVGSQKRNEQIEVMPGSRAKGEIRSGVEVHRRTRGGEHVDGS